MPYTFSDSGGCGTGRYDVSQGAIATARGLGAALSASLAGTITVWAGYLPASLTRAAIAGIGFAVYLLFMPETKPLTPAAAQPG